MSPTTPTSHVAPAPRRWRWRRTATGPSCSGRATRHAPQPRRAASRGRMCSRCPRRPPCGRRAAPPPGAHPSRRTAAARRGSAPCRGTTSRESRPPSSATCSARTWRRRPRIGPGPRRSRGSPRPAALHPHLAAPRSARSKRGRRQRPSARPPWPRRRRGFASSSRPRRRPRPRASTWRPRRSRRRRPVALAAREHPRRWASNSRPRRESAASGQCFSALALRHTADLQRACC
mmetsp:Transcript_3943/g.11404  ORF Transcript_3943/g.11404 Transcript_3943/m.11404 type:complete len:233 (-) Transcript_3943:71-769(-)